MAPSVGHILVAFDGAERWAFFYLSFGARSLWDDMVPGSETLISGWAGANSRFAALREFAGKGLICFTVCAAQWWLRGENRRNSRFDGKSREFRPTPLRNAAPQRRWRRSSRRWNRDAGGIAGFGPPAVLDPGRVAPRSIGHTKRADLFEQRVDLASVSGGVRARQPQLLERVSSVFRVLRAEFCCSLGRFAAAPDQ
jgi:hypothetical protein